MFVMIRFRGGGLIMDLNKNQQELSDELDRDTKLYLEARKKLLDWEEKYYVLDEKAKEGKEIEEHVKVSTEQAARKLEKLQKDTEEALRKMNATNKRIMESKK